MRILLLLVALLLPMLASAQAFRSERLTWDDARLLQAALSFEGSYVGRIDGEWGRRSAAALEEAAGSRPSERDAILAMGPFIDDFDTAGWEPLNRPGTSMLLPVRLLDWGEGDDHFEFATPDRSLVVRIVFRSARRTGDMHRWLEAEHAGADPFYRADTEAAFVSKGRLRDGKTVYLRTIRLAGVHETALVQWTPRQASRGRVVVASLSNGHVPSLTIPERGYIAAILARPPDRPTDRPLAPEAARDAPPVRAEVGTGTGFYVNATDLVTAAHVVAGCDRLTLADGSGLLVVSEDAGTDLAILRAARRSGTWIDLAETTPGLGASVMAVGFPYATLFQQGLSATRGNISALRGLDGEAHVVMITAPVQPGNSGGPLLDEDGRVVGVVVYRASDRYTLSRTDTLPQNMNGATRLAALRRVLSAADIALPGPKPSGADMAAGLPSETEAAVVQVICTGG